MARSGADFLSAHGPRGKVPMSRLGTMDAANLSDSEWKDRISTILNDREVKLAFASQYS